MSATAEKTEVGSCFVSNYPPYSAWSAEQLVGVRAGMNLASEAVPLGLYVHLPFCRKRCKFCYYKVFTDKNSAEVERYLAALSREIELVSRLPVIGGRPFRFVYFGGGTPSFLSSRQLERLVDRLRDNISWELAEEVTFECEPGTLTEAKVHTLQDIGITRLSLGVEHFDDEILRENGRAHESREIDRAW
ncbi:MAG: radical SAM protein, partial [Pirellulales bacterium]|nr:radical SAM protein [Pirellulales bacterium]